MRRQVISSLCEHHRVYLHKPRQYSLVHTQSIYSLLLLGYKTVQRVTILNTAGNFNTMVSIIVLYCNIITYYNIIMLWDHRHKGGPSLTETLLRGAYLYCPPLSCLRLSSGLCLSGSPPEQCAHLSSPAYVTLYQEMVFNNTQYIQVSIIIKPVCCKFSLNFATVDNATPLIVLSYVSRDGNYHSRMCERHATIRFTLI